jgi:hypothetical protein
MTATKTEPAEPAELIETSTDSPAAPAGWHDDPSAEGKKRYWDGSEWTDHVAPPPPPQVATGPAPAAKTSGYAIASLVLGLVWLYGIGSVLAIIFGSLAKRDIKEANGTVTGGGMATAGLVLGIIGVAIVALVILVAATADSGTSSSTSFQ